MTDLTEQDASKLFNDISSALREDDLNKLAELTAKEDKEEVETPEEEPTPEEIPDGEEVPKEEPKPEEEEPSPATPEEEEEPGKPSDDEEEDDKPEEDDKLVELRNQLEKLAKENNDLRSQAGRVPYMQKRLRQIDKKLEELRQAKDSPSSQASTKIAPKVEEVLKGVKDYDSDLADAILKALTTAVSELAEDNHSREIQNLESLREEEAQAYQEAEVQRLLTMVPNAREVLSSPHWAEWRNKQSRAVQALADSDDADDVVFAINKYAEDMRKEFPNPADDKPEQDTEALEKAKKLEEERRRKKENAAKPTSPSGQGKVSLPDDPEALFRKFSDQIRKERLG